MAILSVTQQLWAIAADKIVAGAFSAGARDFVAAASDRHEYCYDFLLDVPGFDAEQPAEMVVHQRRDEVTGEVTCRCEIRPVPRLPYDPTDPLSVKIAEALARSDRKFQEVVETQSHI